MIGLIRSVAGLSGGKWLLAGLMAVIVALGVMLGLEKLGHANTRTDLAAMTGLRKQERDNHRLTKANFRAAMTQAKLDQAAAIAAREDQWRKQSDATETQIRDELGTALAAADAYSARMRAAASTGTGLESDTGGNHAAGVASPAANIKGASGMPLMDDRDLQICTVNTIKARGWQVFYEGLRLPEGGNSNEGL